MPLEASVTDMLQKLGFTSQTPIQTQAIPILARGDSLLALAPTGSGKTIAFLLPLMLRLNPELSETQLLILAPTRELGAQIAQVAETLALVLRVQVRSALGGQKADTQKIEILKKPAVVVATPGRALDLLDRNVLQLQSIQAVVLDEADLMMGMGFEAQVDAICDYLPQNVQIALFSATENGLRSKLHQRLVADVATVDVRSSQDSEPSLCQAIVVSGDKTERLAALLTEIDSRVKTGILFCQTRETVHGLARALRKSGFVVEALSGELGQVERATVLRRFKAGGLKYLVATNLAARGIDVKDLTVVINYDLPSTLEEYIHRAGRSGRAGKPGWTINMCGGKSYGFLHGLLAGSGIVPEIYAKKECITEEIPAVAPCSFAKIHLNKGKSSKMRPGDILGALTKDLGLLPTDVGSIFIFDHFTHVEINRNLTQTVMRQLVKVKNIAVRATQADHLVQ